MQIFLDDRPARLWLVGLPDEAILADGSLVSWRDAGAIRSRPDKVRVPPRVGVGVPVRLSSGALGTVRVDDFALNGQAWVELCDDTRTWIRTPHSCVQPRVGSIDELDFDGTGVKVIVVDGRRFAVSVDSPETDVILVGARAVTLAEPDRPPPERMDASMPKKQRVSDRELENLFEHARPTVPASMLGRGVFAPPMSTSRLRPTSDLRATLPEEDDVSANRGDEITDLEGTDAWMLEHDDDVAAQHIARSRVEAPDDFVRDHDDDYVDEESETDSPLPVVRRKARASKKIRSWADVVAREGGVTPRALARMVSFLTKHQCAKPFLRPVTVRGYTDIIEFPTDLSLIRERIEAGVIADVAGLVEHLQRMCSNAVAYNGPDSVYTRRANALWKIVAAQPPL
jgi:hypothetical protein